MVQPTIQQKCINERRPKIPKVGRQAFSEKLKTAENIQQKHCQGQLQLHVPNLASIIKAHNNEVSKDTSMCLRKPCNCQKKDLCPLNGECQSNNIIYNTEVENMSRNETKVYIDLTEHPFKQRYSNHIQSIRHEKYRNSMELSKYV